MALINSSISDASESGGKDCQRTTPASTQMEIVLLGDGEIERAATVMAGAFASDPLGLYILPDPQNRLTMMSWFWRQALHRSHLYAGNYTTAPEIRGVASWLPPGTHRETLWDLWQPFWEVLRCAGWRSTYRCLALLEFVERLRDRHCSSPHWYLDGLAVALESQGQGIGSLLLQPVLERVDREGQTCCLYTSTERAVRFYQRQGFTVCEEVRFQTQAPHLWYMVRSPQ
ncbi:GNAT family N-acetyltransferase [Geitlerinema splendidum]|nr:GNAT family N-acetyltransferase [Geitlerinema splendidum]